MFDFGNANDAQKLAISHTDGPLLITAGPGTGKTFTLVQRVVFLIQEHNIHPEEIMIATFTEKAAKELITRITNELVSRNIKANINEMYIGTFHSICLRLIKEHLEYTRIKKNYRLLDSFDQQYLIFQNISSFRKINGFSNIVASQGAWKQANELCFLLNNLTEELIDYNQLVADGNTDISTVGQVLEQYALLLTEKNMLDFSSIQTEAYWLLKNNQGILDEIYEQVKYIMIDEYQDTNYIQEQIVFLLAGERQNIAVVGDDDQGLYRFRGATIRNILEFPRKFEENKCKQVALVINYRSDSQIVDFYNRWISVTGGADFKFRWDKYRYDKVIVPHEKSMLKSPTVIKVSGEDDEDEWHENVLCFIRKLKSSGKLTNLNQIAFLFNSVKSDKPKALAQYLEQNGINVYSPRSDMYFERDEIKLIIGCLILIFPVYANNIGKRNFSFVDEALCRYYENCVQFALPVVKANRLLLRWIQEKGKTHAVLHKNTDYAFSGLLYQLFEFTPFAKILDDDLNNGAVDLRPIRNLAKLSQIVAKFEYLHHVNIFTQKKFDDTIEKFFNMYMRFLFNGGIGEYEDDTEYAPSGCVSFLTIHQSKGMEFPIVIVGSLGNNPRNRNSELLSEIENKYFYRKAFEPADTIKFFDFWRLYYTAFSRAQDLLVLSCNEKEGQGRQPSKYFEDSYKNLLSFDSPSFDITEFDIKKVKEVNLKETYSFTSYNFV